MAKITEDYVSFETAKLLKEKGFDVPCNCYGAYNGVNLAYRFCLTNKYTDWNKHFDKTIISCPTLQMAMKWLRDEYNIDIVVFPHKRKRKTYYARVLRNFYIEHQQKCNIYVSYEEAVEAAIKYGIENLI